MSNYRHRKALITAEWVSRNMGAAKVLLIEVDINATAYHKGHIENAVGWNWQSQLQNNIRRDLPGQHEFEELCVQSGVSNVSTVILYGDHENWFAAKAFWQFKYFGHNDVRLMNGGRKKWELEVRLLTTEPPNVITGRYKASKPDPSFRVRREHVFEIMDRKDTVLLDVRSPDEFTGTGIAPPGMTDTAQRAGHIPGAINIPWSRGPRQRHIQAYEEVVELYGSHGIGPDREEVAYRRVGERSLHTWFVLKYLEGSQNASNYDGS